VVKSLTILGGNLTFRSLLLFLRYHSLYDEVKDEHDPKEEYEFEEQAKLFIDSYKAMQKKYQLLLIKQSQVRTNFLLKLSRILIKFP
jgi:hypothetical protein